MAKAKSAFQANAFQFDAFQITEEDFADRPAKATATGTWFGKARMNARPVFGAKSTGAPALGRVR